ncbi:FAD-binding domain-containing protein [Sphingomonas sp. 37zxx]|uniref:FAD-binding domain-containing protein n=1 Tax=Sphingomonas sp. 37zxx TaxID=1550073 RepID=UPI00053BE826|nr:FAD-binding domain-containing protein [Sphingomonas sp. 37zxx]
MTQLLPTRAAALDRLVRFTPLMGRSYADRRNADPGPEAERDGWPEHVSKLSPYLRYRLVDEREVLAAALGAHGPDKAEKFVSEVLWRGYFRGWLEQRPGTWPAYVAGRDAALALVDANGGVARDYRAACEGRTGIDCFDAWATELTTRNWLHNHARMWFASIWIFTLRLPWELGADFFMRHLIDGDSASNTLSWRWVAGLHTRGKAYAARAENIARYTGGRFAPTGLVEEVEPLVEAGEVPRVAFAPPPVPQPAGDWALVLHEGDTGIAAPIDRAPSRVIGLASPDPRAAPAVRAFAEGALADAVARAGEIYGCPGVVVQEAAAIADAAAGAMPVAPYVPVGALGDRGGLPVATFVREYDAAIWPLGTAGFFKVKTGAPARLRALGLPA